MYSTWKLLQNLTFANAQPVKMLLLLMKLNVGAHKETSFKFYEQFTQGILRDKLCNLLPKAYHLTAP